MSFDYPVMLTAFLVYIPLILYDLFSNSRKQKQKLPEVLQKRLRYSSILFRLFIAFSIIALSGPRWGTGFSASEYRRGLDIVYAIDVSRSMDIYDGGTDASPVSRLNRGISIAEKSAQSVLSARFAAVIGRSRGYLALPLTYNNEAFFGFLASLDGSSMTGRSTNLESLVLASADGFQSSSAARKVIVLISDGESHSGNLRSAISRCVRDGIIINAVAVGSDEGRQIYTEENNPESDTVVSRRDSAVMRMAAERTGGIYIDGSREDASAALSAHLQSLAQETRTNSGKTESKQRYALFIMFAILAYGACKFIPLVPAGKLPGNKTFVSIIAVLFILTSCSEGKLLLVEANYLNSRGRHEEAIIPYLKALNYEDSAPYAEYGLGLAFYSLDEGVAAIKRYDSSQKMLGKTPESEHRELRFRNHYNSGIIYFEDENYQAAAESFREALRADPRKTEAKRNLELSLLSITIESNRNNRTESGQETREILFDFIREQEQQHWKSREWAPEEKFIGPDW